METDVSVRKTRNQGIELTIQQVAETANPAETRIRAAIVSTGFHLQRASKFRSRSFLTFLIQKTYLWSIDFHVLYSHLAMFCHS